jgi:hypothetical protein
VCAALALDLRESQRVSVTELHAGSVIATVEVAPAPQGKRTSDEYAEAIVAQANDAQSQLRQRLPALRSGRLLPSPSDFALMGNIPAGGVFASEEESLALVRFCQTEPSAASLAHFSKDTATNKPKHRHLRRVYEAIHELKLELDKTSKELLSSHSRSPQIPLVGQEGQEEISKELEDVKAELSHAKSINVSNASKISSLQTDVQACESKLENLKLQLLRANQRMQKMQALHEEELAKRDHQMQESLKAREQNHKRPLDNHKVPLDKDALPLDPSAFAPGIGEALEDGAAAQEQSLPPGWQMEVNDGKMLYVNHQDKIYSWVRPAPGENQETYPPLPESGHPSGRAEASRAAPGVEAAAENDLALWDRVEIHSLRADHEVSLSVTLSLSLPFLFLRLCV